MRFQFFKPQAQETQVLPQSPQSEQEGSADNTLVPDQPEQAPVQDPATLGDGFEYIKRVEQTPPDTSLEPGQTLKPDRTNPEEKWNYVEKYLDELRDREKSRMEQRFGKGPVGRFNRWLNTTDAGRMVKVMTKVGGGVGAVAATGITGGAAGMLIAPFLFGMGIKTASNGVIEGIQELAGGRKQRLALEAAKQGLLLNTLQTELDLRNVFEAQQLDRDQMLKTLTDVVERIKVEEAKVIDLENQNLQSEVRRTKIRGVLSTVASISGGIFSGVPLGYQDFSRDGLEHVVKFSHHGFGFLYHAYEKVAQTTFQSGIMGGLSHVLGHGMPSQAANGLWAAAVSLVGATALELRNRRNVGNPEYNPWDRLYGVRNGEGPAQEDKVEILEKPEDVEAIEAANSNLALPPAPKDPNHLAIEPAPVEAVPIKPANTKESIEPVRGYLVLPPKDELVQSSKPQDEGEIIEGQFEEKVEAETKQIEAAKLPGSAEPSIPETQEVNNTNVVPETQEAKVTQEVHDQRVKGYIDRLGEIKNLLESLSPEEKQELQILVQIYETQYAGNQNGQISFGEFLKSCSSIYGQYGKLTAPEYGAAKERISVAIPFTEVIDSGGDSIRARKATDPDYIDYVASRGSRGFHFGKMEFLKFANTVLHQAEPSGVQQARIHVESILTKLGLNEGAQTDPVIRGLVEVSGHYGHNLELAADEVVKQLARSPQPEVNPQPEPVQASSPEPNPEPNQDREVNQGPSPEPNQDREVNQEPSPEPNQDHNLSPKEGLEQEEAVEGGTSEQGKSSAESEQQEQKVDEYADVRVVAENLDKSLAQLSPKEIEQLNELVPAYLLLNNEPRAGASFKNLTQAMQYSVSDSVLVNEEVLQKARKQAGAALDAYQSMAETPEANEARAAGLVDYNHFKATLPSDNELELTPLEYLRIETNVLGDQTATIEDVKLKKDGFQTISATLFGENAVESSGTDPNLVKETPFYKLCHGASAVFNGNLQAAVKSVLDRIGRS